MTNDPLELMDAVHLALNNIARPMSCNFVTVDDNGCLEIKISKTHPNRQECGLKMEAILRSDFPEIVYRIEV